MQPRFLITLIEDENKPNELKSINVSVRVGQAVDTVAQAGRPKTITGFQTHTTPVVLAYGERAELANEECKSLNSINSNSYRHFVDSAFGRLSDFEKEPRL